MAGASIATVSPTHRGLNHVNPETLKKILDAAVKIRSSFFSTYEHWLGKSRPQSIFLATNGWGVNLKLGAMESSISSR